MGSNLLLPNLVTIPKGYRVLNSPGMELANLAMWHQLRIGNTGMLAAPAEPATTSPLGTTPNPVATVRPVWLDEPVGSIPFDEQGAIAIPPASFATDTIVVQMRVPHGFDGVIKWISNNVVNSSAPFQSGELVWRILINGRPARNFGNISQEKGTINQGRQISPLHIFSGDVITYTVQQVTGSILTGTTECSLSGYFYPSKGIS